MFLSPGSGEWPSQDLRDAQNWEHLGCLSVEGGWANRQEAVWRLECPSLWQRRLYVPGPGNLGLLLHSPPGALRSSGGALPAVQWGGAMFWSYSGPVQCLVQIDA
eukprot:jgi/Picre1/27077/NNA_000047.t1